MAKKVIISFQYNPETGNRFTYNFYVAGLPILYNSESSIVDITYTNVLSEVSPTKVLIKPNITETINDTVIALSTYYINFSVVYTKVNNTIEVVFSQDDSVVDSSTNSVNIGITSLNIFNENLKLRYFLEYLDPTNASYRIDIFQKGYTSNPELIQGYGVLQVGSVKDNLEPIRGSALTLNLEATDQLNLSDLYTDDENQFTVNFYRNSTLLFNGFIKPDGVFQSFVTDRWEMSIECVDGLGILEDLAFVKGSGLPWVGKLNGIEIINRCLQRSNLQMNINTSVNIYYEGLIPSDTLDPLTEMYLSADRFVKTDKGTIMNCSEVLESVLNLFNAVITQVNGEWYIYRPNDVTSPIVTFRRYTYDGTYTNLSTINLARALGSQINGRYPHHCNSNQQIMIKGSVSAFRINYKYGFLKGLLKNPKLIREGTNYLNWTENNMAFVIFDPLSDSGLRIKQWVTSSPAIPVVMKSDPITLKTGEKVKLTITYNRLDASIVTNSEYAAVYFRVKQGNYYYNSDPADPPSRWSLGATNALVRADLLRGDNTTEVMTYELEILPFLNDGDLSIEIIQPKAGKFQVAPAVIQINSIDFINITDTNNGAQGEFHTVQRQNRPSSIARDTKEIFNGDSPSIVYEGAVFKSDKETPTDKWFRRNISELKPILQISAEDTLRMSQKPAKLFSGDIYGFIPYFSVIKIDSIDGNFMFIEYAYDTKTNIIQAKILEIMSNELPDISYLPTFDYGSTVKPTITS